HAPRHRDPAQDRRGDPRRRLDGDHRFRRGRCVSQLLGRAVAQAANHMEQEGLTVEELTKLFSVLSHDLKSPIFSVDGFSELLIADYTDCLDEEGQDFLRRIRSSVQQMKKVLDEMSRVVKLLSRPTAPRPTPLREIVEEVLLKYNYMIEDGGVKVDVHDDLPTVDVEPEKKREANGAMIWTALFFYDGATATR